jgi:hypothetical protein
MVAIRYRSGIGPNRRRSLSAKRGANIVNELADLAGVDVLFTMPVTASTRETVQMHIGAAILQKQPEKYLSMDFGALLETMALTAGITVSSENKKVLSGLEI